MAERVAEVWSFFAWHVRTVNPLKGTWTGAEAVREPGLLKPREERVFKRSWLHVFHVRQVLCGLERGTVVRSPPPERVVGGPPADAASVERVPCCVRAALLQTPSPVMGSLPPVFYPTMPRHLASYPPHHH